MHEGDGLWWVILCFLGLPIMDAPVHHSDQAKDATDCSERFCVAKNDAEQAKEWNQGGWRPMQHLDRTELVGDVLANEKQTPTQYGCDTERSFDRLQSNSAVHWFITGMGRILESTPPSTGHAG